jgi:hypothetical protein
MRRHSKECPCQEHIRTQTQYFAPLLKKLGNSSRKKQQQIVSKCDPCFIRFLSKCACGVLHTNIRLKKHDYSVLKDSKNLLLKLAQPHVSITAKRSSLKKQSGGAFPFFSILGTLASSVLSDLFLGRSR